MRAIVYFEDFSDPESGMAFYSVALGDCTGAPECVGNVLAFTQVLASPMQVTGLQLPHGSRLYAVVRAYNGAEAYTEMTSPGVVIDRTPPLCSAIADGNGPLAEGVAELSYQLATSLLTVCVVGRCARVPGGRGGVTQTRISAIQILYEIFVRNLFGVFKDLCRYALGIAFAT